MGDGTRQDSSQLSQLKTPMKAADNSEITDVLAAASAINGKHSLYIAKDGTVWTFGDNSSKQLGLQTVVGSADKAVQIGATADIDVNENSLFMKIGETKNVGSILTLNGIFNLITDSAAAPVPDIEYEVQNSGVADVLASGQVKAKAAGITYVRLKMTPAGHVAGVQDVVRRRVVRLRLPCAQGRHDLLHVGVDTALLVAH